jgi:4-hydroxybenzoate polyprenyltransferase
MDLTEQPRGGRAWSRLRLYARLTRIDRPVGTLLLLWPTLTALWFAAVGWPGTRLLVIFVLGTWLMRSAGCALNDVADRHFDARVKRTALRVVATGEVSVREALWVAATLALLAASTLIGLNGTARLFSLPAVALAASYPFFKRFFDLPQAVLGIAFSFGIPMAFAAAQGQVGLLAWVMLAANFFWVMAYDTQYAIVDRDDDLRIGVHSAAILFGRADVAVVAACYMVYFVAMAAIGWLQGRGAAYAIGWVVAVACAVRGMKLTRTRERELCFRAFLHNQWVGLAIFGGTLVDFAMQGAGGA